MTKEILIQTGKLQANNPDARNIAHSVLTICQGLYNAELHGLAGATFAAEKVIADNIGIYSQVVPKGIRIPEQKGGLILANVEKLTVEQIAGASDRIKTLMKTIAASPTLEDARRLCLYLNLKPPTTEKSFRILKGIAVENRELFSVPDQNLAEQKLTQLAAILLSLDKSAIEAARTQSEDINKLRGALEEKYKSVVEELIRDGAVEAEDIKKTIVDEIIHRLRRDIGQIDSIKRPVSQYELRVNSIIDDENLAAQNDHANQLMTEKQIDYKKTVLPGIARKRAGERILQAAYIARLLRQRIVATQNNVEKNQPTNDDEIAKQTARYIRKHKDGDFVKKEESRLKEQIDILISNNATLSKEDYEALVRTTLSQKEYSILKPLIERKSQRDAVYKLGEAHLREKIAKGISEEDVEKTLLQKLTDNALRNFLSTIITEAVDQAVRMSGINGSNILSNPEVLSINKGTIVTNAILILKKEIDAVVEDKDTPTNDRHHNDVIVLFRRDVKHVSKDGNNEINGSNIDASGLDWTSVLEALGVNPTIGKIEFHNLDGLNRGAGETVRLALEYCPLYKPGKLHESSLAETAQGVDDIVNSRVGRKWIATQAALQTLNNFLRANGRSLEVKITFADWAVLAGKETAANGEALRQHERLYYAQVSQLCKQIGIPYEFQLMSAVLATTLQKLGIGQFVIAENSLILQNISENPNTILQRLGFKQSDIVLTHPRQRERARDVLKDLLKSCEGNITLAKGLVGAYCMTLPILLQECDMHLGMERSQNLLDLSTLAQTEKAVMNVLVK